MTEQKLVKAITSSAIYIALDELVPESRKKTVLIEGKVERDGKMKKASMIVAVNLLNYYVVEPIAIDLIDKIMGTYKGEIERIEEAVIGTVSYAIFLIVMKYQLTLLEVGKIFGSSLAATHLSGPILDMIEKHEDMKKSRHGHGHKKHHDHKRKEHHRHDKYD